MVFIHAIFSSDQYKFWSFQSPTFSQSIDIKTPDVSWLFLKLFLLKEFCWEQFHHRMDRIAARLDASNHDLGQYMTFAIKAVDEINRLHQNAELNQGVPIRENEEKTSRCL